MENTWNQAKLAQHVDCGGTDPKKDEAKKSENIKKDRRLVIQLLNDFSSLVLLHPSWLLSNLVDLNDACLFKPLITLTLKI